MVLYQTSRRVNFLKMAFVSLIFSYGGYQKRQAKVTGNRKKHAYQKNAKKWEVFLGFPNYVKQFMLIYSTLKYTHTSLKRTLTKGR